MDGIDIMNNNNMYFMIEKRNASVGKQIFITTGLHKPAKVGQEVYVEGITGIIDEILEERPCKIKGRIFQKMNITVHQNERLV